MKRNQKNELLKKKKKNQKMKKKKKISFVIQKNVMNAQLKVQN